MKYTIVTLLAATLSLGGVALAQDRVTEEKSAAGQARAAEKIIAEWSKTPKDVAKKMIDKYGPPDELTESMLIWHENGPWKRSIVYREEVEHLFPKPHTDVLEQFLDVRVAPDKFDDLARYDGSVIVERTKGEISARCDKEEMNFLALNLAKEVADGKTSADEARRKYADTVKAFMAGKPSRYVQGLLFTPDGARAADPDKTVLKE